MKILEIGNHRFNCVVDNSIPIGKIIFQDPRNGKEVGRIVNIGENNDEALNDVLVGAYEATKVIQGERLKPIPQKSLKSKSQNAKNGKA